MYYNEKLKILLNVALSPLFAILAFSGFVMSEVLPERLFGANSRVLSESFSVFMGLTREEWRHVHDSASNGSILLIFAHLGLHLVYIKNLPKLLLGPECKKIQPL